MPFYPFQGLHFTCQTVDGGDCGKYTSLSIGVRCYYYLPLFTFLQIHGSVLAYSVGSGSISLQSLQPDHDLQSTIDLDKGRKKCYFPF